MHHKVTDDLSWLTITGKNESPLDEDLRVQPVDNLNDQHALKRAAVRNKDRLHSVPNTGAPSD